MSKDRQPKQKPHKGRKYEKPVSLWGMTLEEAVAKLAKKRRGADAKKA